jgi:hypothetical protein
MKISKHSLLHLCLCFVGQIAFAQPFINSFSPASGPAGTSITINGTNFSTNSLANTVYFGPVRAVVSSASFNQLSIIVPFGATYEPISVTVNGLTAYSASQFLITFSNSNPISEYSFEPKIDFATDTRPNDILMADFNNDGKPDIATANNINVNNAATISILRNKSTVDSIGFDSSHEFPSGGQSYTMASGDFDGDGKIDLVVSSIVESNISIFRNTSSGSDISFAPRLSFATGDGPYSIAVNDLNLDGKPDIVVANNSSGTISILINNGSGGNISFASKTDLITGVFPSCVAVGDLDGDYKPDIVVVNTQSNNYS